ncbi:MAG TPA: hypothetical protein PLF81_10450 [Candidatus Anammoximicrobium sp.]|nr:hypothetical protein [Candidatus Anammoximicrobium sp.]
MPQRICHPAEEAPIYEQNEFTKNTTKEVDFVIEELTLPAGASVLDVGWLGE